MNKILIPPPINAEKKLVKIFCIMLDIKLPSRLVGNMIKEYLIDNDSILILMPGTDFCILWIFRSDIIVIDKKNDTIIELMPMSGVRAIRDMNNIIDPII